MKPGKKSSSHDPQMITFLGSEAHRNYIKEYLKKDNGLFSIRSHCHIVLLSYSTLVSEFAFFQSIIWDALVLDESFGLLSNYSYGIIITTHSINIIILIIIIINIRFIYRTNKANKM